MKRITILGSTGSIGRNTLEIIEGNREEFEVIGLSTHQRVDLLYQQCLLFKPKMVCITGDNFPIELFEKLKQLEIDVVTGKNGLRELSSRTDVDVLVNALVGSVGLLPTLDAIENNVDIALANKETLVMAGEIITSVAKQKGVKILPVDSEHSAIFQCLQGENTKAISRLLLTASGGPFFDLRIDELDDVTVEQALHHPNWEMGKKISIDSATMMNKGLEVIEAYWLFQIPISQIEVVIHQQSIIHSFVEFIDGSLKAQLGAPDMKVPIQYALTYPNRKYLQTERINFDTLKKLTFDIPDYKKFPSCALAYESIKKGGTAPAVLNAANEVAVFHFLNKRIRFSAISKFVEKALEKHREIQNPTIEEILAADVWTRNFVNDAVNKEEILQVAF